LKSYLQFSRIQETQADSFALEMLKRSKVSYVGIKELHKRLSEEEHLNKDLQSKYYRSHPFFKSRLDQIERFESKASETFKKTNQIYIYNRKINLKYLNNKITAYNKDPFHILDKHSHQSNTLSRYASTIA
jgi:predicted Zn-dependent protease